MRSRAALLAVMTLMLVHQVVAGVFGGGTILCISGTGGVALQPIGMTCCAVHGPQATADGCCDAEAVTRCVGAMPADCQGCTDHLVNIQPTLMPQATDLALPQAPPVVIALIGWPSMSTTRVSSAPRQRPDHLPPPLQFLATVVLRC